MGLSVTLCCSLGQTGEAGLGLLQRPAQDKLHDREHTDTKRQEVRETFNLLVELDKQRCDMDPALEAVEDALNAVFVAIAQHRLLQRQPRGSCIGDKRLPAQPSAQGREAICLTSDLGDVVAGLLNHPFLPVQRPSKVAYCPPPRAVTA